MHTHTDKLILLLLLASGRPGKKQPMWTGQILLVLAQLMG
jgi:hypothetical protein